MGFFCRKWNSPIIMKIYRYLVVFKNVFENIFQPLFCATLNAIIIYIVLLKQKWLKMLLFLLQEWAIHAVTLICELYLLGLFAYRFITAIFKKSKNVSSIFNLHRLIFFFSLSGIQNIIVIIPAKRDSG